MPDPTTVRTASDLVELIHEWWGITEYDEYVRPAPPWWKLRQTEAGKLNRLMKRRRVRLDELVCAAEFCRREGVRVKASQDLFRYVSEAMAVRARRKRELEKVGRDNERQNAISDAFELGLVDIADALLRATDDAEIDALIQGVEDAK